MSNHKLLVLGPPDWIISQLVLLYLGWSLKLQVLAHPEFQWFITIPGPMKLRILVAQRVLHGGEQFQIPNK
ncbi:hypothetical protein JAAARDRAFT_32257 [Jaapia argillacea MUCL 33604]|uniref:Uncharacterized protein n=1 Tax=Jaapia argillacea MUCL 33604 TaxID=933084 RepID=A0A067Q528_9AGAM|nr:hypothetical protein JAAARDRAFT_32257 [Jaapia argillacea MUCL 33604]